MVKFILWYSIPAVSSRNVVLLVLLVLFGIGAGVVELVNEVGIPGVVGGVVEEGFGYGGGEGDGVGGARAGGGVVVLGSEEAAVEEDYGEEEEEDGG